MISGVRVRVPWKSVSGMVSKRTFETFTLIAKLERKFSCKLRTIVGNLISKQKNTLSVMTHLS